MYSLELAHMKNRLELFLQFCFERNVAVVVCAGNAQTITSIEEHMPQNFPSQPATDAMVIVGAVDKAGDIYNGMVDDPNGRIAVYAPGVAVEAPTTNGDIEPMEGTSVSTAITASKLSIAQTL